MIRVKRRYWSFRHELRQLALWFIGEVPVGPGNWLRARCLPWYLKKLGHNTVIQHGFRVFTPEKVSIGANCNFAQGVFITGGGGVTIGDWVGLGPDVKVWSVNHRFDDPDQPWLLQGSNKKEVVIGDDVWLAANVFVMPGVAIGKGAIVAAGSVVNKSIPPFALVAGNPARVIGWRKKPEDAPSAQADTEVAGTIPEPLPHGCRGAGIDPVRAKDLSL